MATIPAYADTTPEADIVVQVPNPQPEPLTVQPPAYADTTPEIVEAPAYADTEAVGEVTWMDTLQYGFESGENILSNLSILMESIAPIGEIGVKVVDPTADNPFQRFDIGYLSPDEIYGVNFSEMSKEERVSFLKNRRDAQIAQEYEDVIASGEADSGLATVGTVGKAIVDPFNLTIGGSYKAMAFTAGMLGIEFDVLSQIVNDPTLESYNPTQTAVTGTVSAVAAPAVVATLRGAGKVVSKLNKNRTIKRTAKQMEQADTKIEQVNAVIAKAVTEKVPIADMPKYIESATGLTADDLTDLVVAGSKKFKVPGTQEAKQIVDVAQFADDPIGTSLKRPNVWNWIGTLRANLNAESKILGDRLLEMDARAFVRYGNSQQLIKPFADAFEQLPKSVRRKIGLHLANSDTKAANALFQKYNPELAKLWQPIAQHIKDTAKDIKGAGINITEIVDYVPRFVKNIDRLQTKITGKQRSVIQKTISSREIQLGRSLTDGERQFIISEILSGRKVIFNKDKTIRILPSAGRAKGTTSSFQKRAIGTIDDRLYDEYEDLLTSLDRYFRNTASAIEERKFFAVGKSNPKATAIDPRTSIQSLVDAEIKAGRLNPLQQDRVKDLLQTRFDYAKNGLGYWGSTARDINYTTTIGDPIATLTQINDVVGLTSYNNGIVNTVKALLAKEKINTSITGLEDVLAAEMMTSRQISKQALDLVLRLSGFKFVDRLGKNTLMTGAMKKAQALAKTPKGVAKLRKDYGNIFRDQFDQFITDLRANNITDNVKTYAVAELAKMQPISASEMPVKALEHPGYQFALQLKSYAIKQLNLIREDVLQQFKKGNIKEGGKNAAAYITLVVGTGATIQEAKDMFLQRDGFNPEEILTDNMAENLLKFLMASEYSLNFITDTGKFGDASLDMFLGGFGVMADNLNAVGQDIITALSEDEELTKENSKILARAPLFGRIWYNYIGGGLEKWEENQYKKYLEE